jgi:hypothetical protein
MPLGNLERGLQPTDAARDVKRQLWKAVFKTEPPVPFPDDNNLRETLAIRYKRSRRRESYYLLLPTPSSGQESYSSSLLSLLRQALPYLGIFQIGFDTGEQVLVIKEMTLMVWIRDFLSMLGSYR